MIGTFSPKLYQSALDAGLHIVFAIEVARGKMTLDEALGDMDVTHESEFMEKHGLGEEDLRRDPELIVTGCGPECACGGYSFEDEIPF